MWGTPSSYSLLDPLLLNNLIKQIKILKGDKNIANINGK